VFGGWGMGQIGDHGEVGAKFSINAIEETDGRQKKRRGSSLHPQSETIGGVGILTGKAAWA